MKYLFFLIFIPSAVSQSTYFSPTSYNKGFSFQIEYNTIKKKPKHQTFNGVSFEARYFKQLKNGLILQKTLELGYATDTRKEYPYYLINSTQVGLSLDLLKPISKHKTYFNYIGIGSSINYLNKPLLNDFTILPIVSVNSPRGVSYNVPVIVPNFEIKNKYYFSPALEVLFQQNLYSSKNIAVGTNFSFKKYFLNDSPNKFGIGIYYNYLFN